MSKFLSSFVPIACPIILLALVLYSPPVKPFAQDQADSDPQLRIEGLEMKSEILLPCDRGRVSLRSSPRGNGKARVSARTNTVLPINIRWTVSAGKVIGEGLNVVWDLNGNAPGEYSITVIADDGLGHKSAPVIGLLRLAEPGCIDPCTCPSISVLSRAIEVKQGDLLTFEALVLGGDFEDGPKFHWHVENGSVRSGQSTDSIEVEANGGIGAVVTATVHIGGIDRRCLCSQVASESVKIGERTVLAPAKPAQVEWVALDDQTVFIPCPRSLQTRETSDDVVVGVRAFARSNSIRDRIRFHYEVTGGTIVGTGRHVNWDLTGLSPGTYDVAVSADNGMGASEWKKISVTVGEAVCGGHPVCPSVTLSPPVRIGKSDDYIVHAVTDAGTFEDLRFAWNVAGGTIIAGQGTTSVRIRSRWRSGDPTPSVELTLTPSIDGNVHASCRTSSSVFLQKSAVQPELE